MPCILVGASLIFLGGGRGRAAAFVVCLFVCWVFGSIHGVCIFSYFHSAVITTGQASSISWTVLLHRLHFF